MIRSLVTFFESFFFGIMTSIAVDQRFGQYPASAVVDTIDASTSATGSLAVPVMNSEKEGPYGLAAVFFRIRFQPCMCSAVVSLPVTVSGGGRLGRLSSVMNFCTYSGVPGGHVYVPFSTWSMAF